MRKIVYILIAFFAFIYSISYAGNDQFYSPEYIFNNCAKLLNKKVKIKSVAGALNKYAYNLFVDYNDKTGVVTFVQGEFDTLDSQSMQLMYEIESEKDQATSDALQTGKKPILPEIIITGSIIWTRNIIGKKTPGIKMIKLERATESSE